ncbi:MAG: hypothetical protein C6P37_12005 [Caldibacillus debilis]|jgi:hypothetical protein|uniref:Uncharacterized protein n=1 Tax=Caldibacillus debilis TaxID=301148 RepID=A0A150LFM2_9BACI|nr:hypothetical protein B4135_3243 [Caldibacillus debilis]MBO2480924.1 hypothetical protein [Bacillaceae bacterium]MBY6270585.1 hypothetical protein [Bacillaceae bacterium]OUM85164.1 MAG: hypothetical protein BAA03_03705 [Caldibacillus debilis]REJ13832.1 MAG: hypothetical protein C6W57_15485 [Caldibacillus debilis]
MPCLPVSAFFVSILIVKEGKGKKQAEGTGKWPVPRFMMNVEKKALGTFLSTVFFIFRKPFWNISDNSCQGRKSPSILVDFFPLFRYTKKEK